MPKHAHKNRQNKTQKKTMDQQRHTDYNKTKTRKQEQSRKQSKERIILLFDLDCFYAQCERVRLGLDESHETCSLALLQWNSVLAVTYPARNKYKIKRGDTWDDVSKKSNGQCWSIHLKLLDLKKKDGNSNNNDNKQNNAINGDG